MHILNISCAFQSMHYSKYIQEKKIKGHICKLQVVGPFSGPCASGSCVHRAALLYVNCITTALLDGSICVIISNHLRKYPTAETEKSNNQRRYFGKKKQFYTFQS